jgi:enoyl-CoA hydratase/carnithine racemase
MPETRETETSDVVVERHGAVMLVRLNRPDRGNSLGGTLLQQLMAAFDDAARDDGVHAVVTTGNGKAFCVGADVEDLGAKAQLPAREILTSFAVGGPGGLAPLSPKELQADELGNAGRVAQRLWSLQKPTIAAINGAAVGGGLAIAVLHDIRIAAENARLGAGFATLGAAPELGITHLLPRIVGASAAAQLLLTADLISGTEARDVGLVSEAVPHDRVVDRALELADRIAGKPPLAVQATKRLLRQSIRNDLGDQLRAEYTEQVALFDHPTTRAAIDEMVRRLS